MEGAARSETRNTDFNRDFISFPPKFARFTAPGAVLHITFRGSSHPGLFAPARWLAGGFQAWYSSGARNWWWRAASPRKSERRRKLPVFCVMSRRTRVRSNLLYAKGAETFGRYHLSFPNIAARDANVEPFWLFQALATTIWR